MKHVIFDGTEKHEYDRAPEHCIVCLGRYVSGALDALERRTSIDIVANTPRFPLYQLGVLETKSIDFIKEIERRAKVKR